MFNFLPYWLSPFVDWAFIALVYNLSKTFITHELKQDEIMLLWEIVMWCMVSIFLSLIVSYVLFIFLEGFFTKSIKWFHFLVPTIIPAVIGVYGRVKKHNSNIIEKLYREKYGFDKTYQ